MFEKFLSSNAENFRQRYEGTFGFYRHKDKRLLVKLTSVSDAVCTFIDAQSVEYKVNADNQSDIGFEFLPPKSKWYNTPDYGALFVQRGAARQWQRGVSQKNVSILTLKNSQLAQMQVSFPVLSNIFEKELEAKNVIHDFIRGTRTSLALSSHFALNGGLVYFLSEHIGEYSIVGERFTFRVKDRELVRTELSDAMAAAGCTAEINAYE